MDINTIQSDFRDKVGKTVSLVAEGVGRYRVFTPFMFEDGDNKQRLRTYLNAAMTQTR
jgi:hypothetical protein